MTNMDALEKFFVNNKLYNYFYRRTYVKWFMNFCDLKGKTLEIGCGGGWTTESFCNNYDVKMTAIDVDPEQIEVAKKRIGDMAVQADAALLPFKDGSFDNVVEMCSFHHIKNYQKALEEVYRVLKKGGSFFMFDLGMYFLWPFFNPKYHFDAFFTKEDMIKEMKKTGFKVVKHKGKDIFMIQVKK